MVTVVTASKSLAIENWVDKICEVAPHLFAVSSVDGNVALLDTTQGVFANSERLTFPNARCCFSPIDQNTFLVSALDALNLVDLRTFSTVMSLPAQKNMSYLTCTSIQNGSSIIAAGTALHKTDALVEIWDIKTGSKVYTYTELHSDDITSLSFHADSSDQSILLSASADGLFSVLDTRISDEDEAVLGVGNMNASLKTATWLSSFIDSLVVCLSDMETGSLFTSREPELVKEYGDLREMQDLIPDYKPEYAICVDKSVGLDGANLFLASNRGIAQVSIAVNGGLQAQRLLQGSHQPDEIVRAVTISNSQSVIVSGGEDNQIVIWSLANQTSQMEVDSSNQIDETVTGKQKKKYRYKPY